MARIQVVGTRRQPGRCAYCHDRLDALVHHCEGCGTWIHLDCLEELTGSCPTPGCAGTPNAEPPPRRPRHRQPRAERRQRRQRHRRRRHHRDRPTLEQWAREEAVDHHRVPTGWARWGPYSRLALSGALHLAFLAFAVFVVVWAALHPHEAWEALRKGKHGSSDGNGWMSLLFFGGGIGVFGWFSVRWLSRWPRVWDEVGRLLERGRPLPMRLRVWTQGSGKHRQTWARLQGLDGHPEFRFQLSGVLPPGWLSRPRDGTPVLVYGVEDGEPPYLIENGNGQLALVHP